MENTMSYEIKELEEEEQMKYRDWLSIPIELLELVTSYLNSRDYFIFSKTVSKAFPSTIRSLSPPPNIPFPDITSPCLLLFNNKHNYRIFEPIYNYVYSFNFPNPSSDLWVCVSNFNWLLTSNSRSMFFLNPFTNQRVEVPKLRSDVEYVTLKSLSFSSPPTCSDCMIYGIDYIIGDILIYTRKHGELDWTTYEIETKECFEPSQCNPVLYKGSFYFLGENGNLLIFNPETSIYKLTPPDKHMGKKLLDLKCHSFLVLVDGKLVAVHLTFDGTWLRILKLVNRLKLVWEAVEDLGDNMLFLSRASSFSIKATMKGTGNKIYFAKFHDKSGIFYSLKTRKFHSFDGHYSSHGLHGTKEYPQSAWVMAPPIHDLEAIKSCKELTKDDQSLELKSIF